LAQREPIRDELQSPAVTVTGCDGNIVYIYAMGKAVEFRLLMPFAVQRPERPSRQTADEEAGKKRGTVELLIVGA
jgi:hypothetical protein